jgi:hypothetical protein
MEPQAFEPPPGGMLPPVEGLSLTGSPAPALPLVPFEDLEGIPSFWTRVGEMFRLLFSDPLGLFDRVPQGNGFGAPWRFTLLLSVPALALVGLIFAVFGFAAMIGALEKHSEVAPFLAFLPLGFLVVLALIPLFMFVGMVVGGALNHLFLWVWGGTKAGVSLEQTVRATGYANAFIQLGGWIPYLGILVQLAGLIWLGLGLAKLHRTDNWRGICAALTPIFLICCCAVLALMAIPALILGKAL